MSRDQSTTTRKIQTLANSFSLVSVSHLTQLLHGDILMASGEL